LYTLANPGNQELGCGAGEQNRRNTKKFEPGVQIVVSKLELPPTESPHWSALYDLLCQPWFQRVWVMQEYILSHEILVLYGGVWKPSDFYVSINEAGWLTIKFYR
jgi:hypothetical protein